MNLIEMNRALRQLRLGGMAATLETRLQQAQAEALAPIDLIACLISDELTRRSDRLLERRRKQAAFRDPQATLDNFDFDFNKKMNRSLVFQLATGNFIAQVFLECHWCAMFSSAIAAIRPEWTPGRLTVGQP
jgi:DNA replication protein DnaC